MISRFVYKLLRLYTPDEQCFKQFKKIVTDFIWAGKKKHNIACSKLVQDYRDGGLKLFDLEVKNLSLKALWIDRILFSKVELKIFKHMLPCPHPIIWSCNINENDIKKVFQTQCVATDIWISWSKFNYKIPVSSHDILAQALWFNTHLRYKNKPYIDYDLLNAGVKIVDIYIPHEERFLMYREFQDKFHSAAIINYRKLIDLIPQSWKEVLIRHPDGEKQPTRIQQIKDNVHVPKFTCGVLIDKTVETSD